MIFGSCNHNSILLKSPRTNTYIMSQLLLIFLFLGILNCDAQYFNNNPYDYLELALRWPNTYCLTHDGGCREIVPQYFTISYLRPRKRGGPDMQYCPSPFTMPNSTVSISFISFPCIEIVVIIRNGKNIYVHEYLWVKYLSGNYYLWIFIIRILITCSVFGF